MSTLLFSTVPTIANADDASVAKVKCEAKSKVPVGNGGAGRNHCAGNGWVEGRAKGCAASEGEVVVKNKGAK
jgi:hypothetical protein